MSNVINFLSKQEHLTDKQHLINIITTSIKYLENYKKEVEKTDLKEYPTRGVCVFVPEFKEGFRYYVNLKEGSTTEFIGSLEILKNSVINSTFVDSPSKE